jgi:hypothetical protein
MKPAKYSVAQQVEETAAKISAVTAPLLKIQIFWVVQKVESSD